MFVCGCEPGIQKRDPEGEVMSKSAQQRGKDFEEDTRQALEYAVRKTKTAYIRLYDTHSAGSFLPAQPCDFMACHDGTTILIECKASEKHSSLADNRRVLTSNLSDNQMAHARLWTRAGGRYLILFLSVEQGKVEVWDGNRVADTYFTPRARLDINDCLYQTNKTNLKESMANILGENYG